MSHAKMDEKKIIIVVIVRTIKIIISDSDVHKLFSLDMLKTLIRLHLNVIIILLSDKNGGF